MKRDGEGAGAEGRLILARGIFRLRRRRGARNHLMLNKRGAVQPHEPQDPREGVTGLTRLRREDAAAKEKAQAAAGIPIEKWQALGNDFLLVWDRTPLPVSKLTLLCHRHLGAGADGVLFLQRQADSIRAQLFNADGSPAEYSGNGLRCVVASAMARQKPKERLLVTIGKLIFEGWLEDTKDAAGKPAGRQPVLVLDPAAFGPEIRSAPSELFATGPLSGAFDADRAYCVKLGNPHLILMVDDLAVVRTPAVAAELDRLRGVTRAFPHGINVSVAQLVGPDQGRTARGPIIPERVLVNTWERGVGPTAACASAATALFHLLRKKGHAGKTLEVASPGGTLTLTEANKVVQMKGPARRVYAGTLDAAALEEP